MRLLIGFLVLLVATLHPREPAHALFHLMKIEQIIGGVNGDTTAQAIQLRLRSGSQNLVSSTRVSAVDATGSNLVLLENMTTDVSVCTAGARILIATPNFANYTDIPLVPDFIMDPIPVSYLTAGQVRFTNDAGSLRYWVVSWGGAGYTGIQTGTFDNDADGNFAPPVSGPLPSSSLQALRFTRSTAASALSITNAGDYTVTAGASQWINNAGTTFTLVTPPPPVTPGDFNDDGVVDTADYVAWQKTRNTNFNLGGNGDETGASMGVVDDADYALWLANYGEVAAGSGGGAPIPEPSTWLILLAAALLVRRRMTR
jgi:hypothetical protein